VGGSGVDWSTEDVAVTALALARPDATLWFGTDTTVGAALYADVVLDMRPEAAIGGTYLLSDDRALAQWARHQPFEVFADGALTDARGATARHTEALLARHLGERTVYWEATGEGDALPRAYRLRGVWPVGEVMVAAASRAACHRREVCATAHLTWRSAAQRATSPAARARSIGATSRDFTRTRGRGRTHAATWLPRAPLTSGHTRWPRMCRRGRRALPCCLRTLAACARRWACRRRRSRWAHPRRWPCGTR